MVLDTNTLTSYFCNWSEKDVPLNGLRDTDGIYINIIEDRSDFGTHSGGTSTNALIIKDIPLTFINDIQAIVLYNRTNSAQSALGLIIELYNTEDDPSLIEPLTTPLPNIVGLIRMPCPLRSFDNCPFDRSRAIFIYFISIFKMVFYVFCLFRFSCASR